MIRIIDHIPPPHFDQNAPHNENRVFSKNKVGNDIERQGSRSWWLFEMGCMIIWDDYLKKPMIIWDDYLKKPMIIW